METQPSDIQNKYRRYLTAIVFLCILTPILVIGDAGLDTASYYESHYGRNALRDCVDPRRADSPCQKYGQSRTDSTVGVLRDMMEAYTICADELNGEIQIKRCVAERLDDEP